MFYVNIAFFILGLMVGLILVVADLAWWIPTAWFGFLVIMAIDAIFFPARPRPRR